MVGECVFCKIIDGEIEATKIFENDLALAFLDANPMVDGHSVVVPKKHVSRFSELDEETAIGLFQVVQKVSRSILDGLEADGTNIGLNDGKAAGQAIPHTHIHIIPRYSGDGGGSLHSIVNSESSMDFSTVRKKLRKNL